MNVFAYFAYTLKKKTLQKQTNKLVGQLTELLHEIVGADIPEIPGMWTALVEEIKVNLLRLKKFWKSICFILNRKCEETCSHIGFYITD